MDEWASEERLVESMGHLLPEVRGMAEVRAAFNEVLQTSELYRRVKSRLSESYSAAQRALSASAAKLKGELATMRQAVSAHCTLLEGESGRLAARREGTAAGGGAAVGNGRRWGGGVWRRKERRQEGERRRGGRRR